ncbi:splicing factor, Prp19-binding domain-containing protein [Blastocladiella britannica]|nr:splicing factor, Prp19-binding domain-containing protein [Blastocladiella britannica]
MSSSTTAPRKQVGAPAPKVQRYWRGRAPGASGDYHSDDDEEDDDNNDNANDDNSKNNDANGNDQWTRTASRSLAVASSKPIDFKSSTAAAGGSSMKPQALYTTLDLPPASDLTADASADPRLRRLAAMQQRATAAALAEGDDAARRRRRHRAREDSDSDDTDSRKRGGPGMERPNDDDSNEEDDEDDNTAMLPTRSGGDAVAAQAERRLLLQQRLLETSRDSNRSDEDESDDEDEDDEDDDEEEETPVPALNLKPRFVPKHLRTAPEASAATDPLLDEAARAATKLKRQQEARALVEAEIKRQSSQVSAHAHELAAVDDADDVDPEAEYGAWRLREFARLDREHALRVEHERELDELERRRNMTADERAAEAEQVARERRDQQAAKPKHKFMQKYHHKGAFYMDRDADVLKRDTSEATPDTFNYQVLPEVLQRKNFGLSGQSKWTHLSKEDTSSKDAAWFQERSVVQRQERKRAGMGDLDSDRSTKRRRAE